MARKTPNEREIPSVLTSSQEIAEKLTRRIFLQEFPKGAKLPAERELAAQFGVARNVVREAVKRLEAIGVLQSWRGSGVYVRDIEFMRGVDLFDTLITREDGSINVEFFREVHEFGASFVRLVVRLAAIHRTVEDIALIKRLVQEWHGFRGDSRKLTELGNEIYRQIVHATHNRVCMGLFSSIERISEKLFLFTDSALLDFEYRRKVIGRVVEAIEERDPGMAEAAVERSVQAIEELLASGAIAQAPFDLVSDS